LTRGDHASSILSSDAMHLKGASSFEHWYKGCREIGVKLGDTARHSNTAFPTIMSATMAPLT
jgi:hypothetical protein